MAGYPSNDNRDVGVKKPAIPPERANAAPRTGEYLPPMANIQRPADNAMHPEPHYPRAHSLPEERPPSSYHPKEHSMSPPRQEHPSHMNEPPSMPMDEIVRPNTGDRGRIDQEYDRFMNERDSDRMINEAAPEAQNRPNSQLASMIIGPRDKPLGLNASSFLIEDESKHKTAEFDLINELLKEDSKFKGVMTQKLNYLKPILHWWNSNNIKSALNAIERINEPWVLNDVFNMVIQTNKLGNLNVEAITIFVAKSRILIESRFQPHIKVGLDIVRRAYKQFRDEIIVVKNGSTINMVDLAREERLKKYDKLLEEFDIVYKLKRIERLAKMDDDIGQMARTFITEMDFVYSKINQAKA
eukprot:TRINITY_DN1530_c0_g1_i7.p1 TRINITY_DN1530_c0_g1~~TRINITY_DN1530_c0_g1_i7.p1  ORF type:complete len:356 (+),score=75.02 TRINITY_DN1530_c0_g1_i7:1250-2317(+)